MNALDRDACYRAVSARDPRFDGRFFTAVTSTGIYCRPICPAHTPQQNNVRFYACAAAAETAGFRPCRRCRPETAPGSPAWAGTSATVTRALRLIHEGFLDDAGVDQLAATLGMTSRHLRRLFDDHVGASPVALAQARRVHFARRLLDDTQLPVTEIAFGAGFGSVRRFNHAFRKSFAMSPSEARRGGERADSTPGHAITLRLPFKPPYDRSRMLAFLGARAIAGLEAVEDGAWRRGPDGCEVEVRFPGEEPFVQLSVPVAQSDAVQTIAARVRRVFDLDADPDAVASHLRDDRALRPLLARYPGVRVPGAWDRFEVAVRVILGQQISVRAATTLASRIVAHAGAGAGMPPAEVLAEMSVERFGVIAARARTIRSLAGAVAGGRLSLEAATPLNELVEMLSAIPGVGRWSAQMIAMRACGDPDAFPAGDLGVKRAMLALDPRCRSERKIIERAELWRPWRAYATQLLWAGYADNIEKTKRRKR